MKKQGSAPHYFGDSFWDRIHKQTIPQIIKKTSAKQNMECHADWRQNETEINAKTHKTSMQILVSKEIRKIIKDDVFPEV